MKNKNTAIILAFFLGGVGGHQFYLGNMVSGLIRAMFMWTLIPAILGLVDAFQFMLMGQREFDARYNWESRAFEMDKARGKNAS